jgi:hypothetical protein
MGGREGISVEVGYGRLCRLWYALLYILVVISCECILSIQICVPPPPQLQFTDVEIETLSQLTFIYFF